MHATHDRDSLFNIVEHFQLRQAGNVIGTWYLSVGLSVIVILWAGLLDKN